MQLAAWSPTSFRTCRRPHAQVVPCRFEAGDKGHTMQSQKWKQLSVCMWGRFRREENDCMTFAATLAEIAIPLTEGTGGRSGDSAGIHTNV